MKKTLHTYYFFIPLLLLCAFYAYKAIGFQIHDFSNYYFGGKFMADGNFDFNIYFPHKFNKVISDLGYENIFASYAPNTPFLALFFAPFSLLSPEAAKLIFNCISIGLFIFSIYRLFDFYRINPKFALLIPVLFLIPIKNNLLFGQVYFLLFFLLSEGWIAYQEERCKSMAFFWSLAILLKVFPMLLIVFLLFKKQGKALLYLLSGCLLLLAFSLIFTGIDVWIFFIQTVLPKASNGEIATAFVPNYQSVFMFLKELLVFDATDNPHSFFSYPVLFSGLMFAFKIGFIALGYFVTQKSRNQLQSFSFWILGMILLSPYGSTYTLILLLFPFLVLLESEVSKTWEIAFCVVLFLICNLPLSVFMWNDFPFSYLRLFLLLALLILFLIRLQQKINWKIIALVSLLPMVFILIFKKNEKIESTIFLSDGPIMIYDYSIRNDTLIADCKDESANQAALPFNYKTSQPLSLKNNQVFYKDKQLTFDKSNKLKPMLFDGKTVLYLSDYDRGIGFYTLRIMELK